MINPLDDGVDHVRGPKGARLIVECGGHDADTLLELANDEGGS